MTTQRYARQLALPEIGPEGQARLAAARVLVVGAGGLGAPALLYLAAAGVGGLDIADDDRVELGNLQRQVLYTTADVGRHKTDAAAARLAELNPDVNIGTFAVRVGADNAVELMRRCDLVVDATDRLETKFLINDAAAAAGRPLVYAAALGFEAQVSVFAPGRGPCLRCLFPEPPEFPAPSCAEAGILGAVTGMAGSLQALEAIKWILADAGDESAFAPLVGRLWVLDGRTLRTRIVELPRDPACPVCRHPSAALRHAAGRSEPREITPRELARRSDALLIDVREESEWADGHLPGAVHLPLSQLLEGVPELPPSGCYVVYCAHGVRSRTAAALLERAGYRGARSLTGGLAGLARGAPGEEA